MFFAVKDWSNKEMLGQMLWLRICKSTQSKVTTFTFFKNNNDSVSVSIARVLCLSAVLINIINKVLVVCNCCYGFIVFRIGTILIIVMIVIVVTIITIIVHVH